MRFSYDYVTLAKYSNVTSYTYKVYKDMSKFYALLVSWTGKKRIKIVVR